MIYLLRKHAIISVPFMRVSVYHPRSGSHTVRYITRDRRERISLQKKDFRKEVLLLHGARGGSRRYGINSETARTSLEFRVLESVNAVLSPTCCPDNALWDHLLHLIPSMTVLRKYCTRQTCVECFPFIQRRFGLTGSCKQTIIIMLSNDYSKREG